MGDQIHVLAKTLLGNDSIEESSLESVRALADRFPYFAPAQFLLAQKLKTADAEAYGKQLQKAALYFHNPLLFEFFINPENFGGEVADEKMRESVDENVSTEDREAQSVSIAELQPDVNVKEREKEKEPGDVQLETAREMNTVGDELPGETDVNQLGDGGAGEKGSVVEIAEEKLREKQEQDHKEKEKEKESQTAPTAALQATSVDAEPLAFEPFHTVDYFASQGIKLSQEDFGKDKFGKQLKSFTEWLKTMKRLPQQRVAAEAPQDAGVAGMAETSIHHSDVVTETMAEVWLKQGNREKAIETYNKLSLQNPSKKAYFAALIEKLK